MKYRKSWCVVLVFILTISTFSSMVSALAPENKSSHCAQIVHATNVDVYGSDIYDGAETLSNVPTTISQSNGELTISMSIDNLPITINASVRGRNISDNVLYFDVTQNIDSRFEVMSAIYIGEALSAANAIDKEYISVNPGTRSILQIYLKDMRSTTRDYYFVEFFDFSLDNYAELMLGANMCEADYWYVMEFSPIDTAINLTETRTQSRIYTVSDTYTFLGHALYAYLEFQKYDDISSIAANSTTDWSSSITITDKYTKCPTNSTYNSDSSKLYIERGTTYEVNAPANAGFHSSIIDGYVSGSSSGSVSINVGVGPLSASIDISQALCSYFSGIDLNSNYTTYQNISPNYYKNLKIEFDGGYYLDSVGENFTVSTAVKAFGPATSAYSIITSRWTINVANLGDNSGFTQKFTESYTAKVA